MKYDVFISYSRQDTAIANKIAKAFDAAGITYFIDRQGIGGGMEFPEVLANAIVESKVFLFLASKNSYASKFSRGEVVFAFNKKEQRDIIPYIIDGSSLPIDLELTFSSINWRNMAEHPIEIVVEDVLRKIGPRVGDKGGKQRHKHKHKPIIQLLREYRLWLIGGIVGLVVLVVVFLLLFRGCGGAPSADGKEVQPVKYDTVAVADTLQNVDVSEVKDAKATERVEQKEGTQEQQSEGIGKKQESSVHDASTVTDYDGNTYRVVKIGKQVWMAENLKTTHYSDGTSIVQGRSASSTTAYWYYPDGKGANKATYGLLYNWAAVMHGAEGSDLNPSRVQGICPIGWHVPSDAEWTQLINYLQDNGFMCDGKEKNVAKSLASQTGWYSSSEQCAVGNDPSTNNASGFSALSAGLYGGEYRFGYGSFFWSSTEYGETNAYNSYLMYYYAGVYRCSYYSKLHGFSVRCVHD